MESLQSNQRSSVVATRVPSCAFGIESCVMNCNRLLRLRFMILFPHQQRRLACPVVTDRFLQGCDEPCEWSMSAVSGSWCGCSMRRGGERVHNPQSTDFYAQNQRRRSLSIKQTFYCLSPCQSQRETRTRTEPPRRLSHRYVKIQYVRLSIRPRMWQPEETLDAVSVWMVLAQAKTPSHVPNIVKTICRHNPVTKFVRVATSNLNRRAMSDPTVRDHPRRDVSHSMVDRGAQMLACSFVHRQGRST